VENAMKHGAGGALGPGAIEIEAEVAAGQTVLRVRDSGAGEGADASLTQGSGLGLRNTVARLEQLYGDAQSFELRRTDDGGAVAEVRLPHHTRSDLHVAGVPASR
jgi:Predicted signal transduction protein with a C-terminal ATPase domain